MGSLSDEERRKLKADLKDLVEEATNSGCWIRSNYQKFVLKPEELAAENAKGSLLWGRSNWELINPQSQIDQMEEHLRQAQKELKKMKRDVLEWKRKHGHL